MQSFEPSGKALKSLTIALSPYDSGFGPDVLAYERTERGTLPLRNVRTAAPSLSDVRTLIEAILTAARTAIGRFLRNHNPSGQLKLVVAGSFHRERDEGGYVKQAPMFDWQGNIVWRHNKLSRYELSYEQMGKSR
ncbi:MAG: hypothetical protein P4L43_17330 [Syntrophobacteraceae bacterium]|nr:hypothetical protein [Syntrophobacteraceae bacterium]